ncbi:hypothetical protein ABZX85_26655 [Streptomyces sp. NPDC004539]|uniref:hypothetical protein n=1 Tax=Streptomyces sp. NPDC004539 TaxID=3154280 RepID=UPI0033A3CFD1
MSEETAARSVFGALGGIVEIGAVTAAGGDLRSASVGEFARTHSATTDRLMQLVRETGDFGDAVMGIGEELCWRRDHEVTVPSLLLSAGWNGGLEEDAESVRRLCEVGADLQLALFLDGLLESALTRTPRPTDPGPIPEALEIAVRLTGLAHRVTPSGVFRTWRAGFLPAILRPDSSAPDWGREGYRTLTRALEDTLDR